MQHDPQTSEAVTLIIVRIRRSILESRYAASLTPMRPNRPHIPSFPSISKSRDTKTAVTTNHLVLPATAHPDISFRSGEPDLPSLPAAFSPLSLRSGYRSVSVRRYLGPTDETRKRKNALHDDFLSAANKIRPFTARPPKAPARLSPSPGPKCG